MAPTTTGCRQVLHGAFESRVFSATQKHLFSEQKQLILPTGGISLEECRLERLPPLAGEVGLGAKIEDSARASLDYMADFGGGMDRHSLTGSITWTF